MAGSAELLRRLDRIEARRDEFVARVATLPEDRRAIRPDPAAWSPIEVIEHFMRAERDVMRGLFEPEFMKARPQRLKNRLLRLVVKGVLRFGIRVKVPVKAMLPEGESSLEELTEMWRFNHGRIREFLQNATPAELAKAWFRHPVSGPLTPPETMDLIEIHMGHHDRQLRDAVAHAAETGGR